MILSVCPNPSVDTILDVPNLIPGGVHRIAAEERYPGGKGTHVALAARELGFEARLLGFWAGPSGEWIHRQCAKEHIACAGPWVEGWTRSCLSLRSASTYNQTELLGTGPIINERDVEKFVRDFEALVLHASIVTLSGSWPAGAPCCSYADLITISQKYHKPVILDCTDPFLTAALDAHPSAVHLNRAEAAALMGTDDPREASAFLSSRCDVAVVTMGAKGAYFTAGGRALHATCPIQATRSAVGSGDCLVAGLAIASARGWPVDEAARFACACGAANCLRAELGMLLRGDVERLRRQVHLERLS